MICESVQFLEIVVFLPNLRLHTFVMNLDSKLIVSYVSCLQIENLWTKRYLTALRNYEDPLEEDLGVDDDYFMPMRWILWIFEEVYSSIRVSRIYESMREFLFNSQSLDIGMPFNLWDE